MAEGARLLRAVEKIWLFEKNNNVITGPEGDLEIKQTLMMLGKSIKQLEAKVDKKPTYAQAAQAARGVPVGALTRRAHAAEARGMEEQRKRRSVIVKVVDPKEKEAFRKEHTKDIMEKLGRAMGEDRKPAGIRRLPSGDIELQIASVENKRWAEDHSDWTKALATSAETARRTYAVMAHAVRIADIDISNQSEAIQGILEQNSKMHKNASILRVSWIKKAAEIKKAFSSLIIETASPNTANDFIKNGLIFNQEIKTCEYFCKESRILQCFNCQQYGHMTRACRNPTRCGHCAGAHNTRECSDQGRTQKKCASCGKPGHEAWARECHIRVQHRLAASQSFANRPILYSVEEATSPAPPRSSRGPSQDEDRIRKRTRSVCSEDSDNFYGTPVVLATQVECSAPQSQSQSQPLSQWQEILRKGRSGSVREPAKRTYTATKLTRANNKKVVAVEDVEL